MTNNVRQALGHSGCAMQKGVTEKYVGAFMCEFHNDWMEREFKD